MQPDRHRRLPPGRRDEGGRRANPDVDFATIDDSSTDRATDAQNVKPITFNTSQAAFLAGYAAAAYSKTGVVGTFGGLQIPTVTIFMDGFADGVKYYNEQKKQERQGRRLERRQRRRALHRWLRGRTAAKQAAQNLLDQNADVIMPVGGPIYQSAAQAVNDATTIAPDRCRLRHLRDRPVQQVAVPHQRREGHQRRRQRGRRRPPATASSRTTPYVGTLENDGVGTRAVPRLRDKVPSTLQGELDNIKAGIIDGSITVESRPPRSSTARRARSDYRPLRALRLLRPPSPRSRENQTA